MKDWILIKCWWDKHRNSWSIITYLRVASDILWNNKARLTVWTYHRYFKILIFATLMMSVSKITPLKWMPQLQINLRHSLMPWKKMLTNTAMTIIMVLIHFYWKYLDKMSGFKWWTFYERTEETETFLMHHEIFETLWTTK
jgi:hypothetical protein